MPLGDGLNTEIPSPSAKLLDLGRRREPKGTFHLNFTFNPGEDNYLAIYDANGLSLIDEIVVPWEPAPRRHMPARLTAKAVSTTPEDWEVRDAPKPKSRQTS